MATLCIVSCGKRKAWDHYPGLGAVRARDAYTGPLTRLAAKYAERFHSGHWVILSAKHGFLRPEDLVPGPYNVSFKDPRTRPIRVEELRLQALRMGLHRYEKVVVLGGRVYADVVREVFPGKKVCAPLEGRPIGRALSLLKRAVETGKPFKC